MLAGAGSVFCAGADVDWMRSAIGLGIEENERDAAALHAMLAAVDRCPAPVIARVQGAALGGGMGLCAVADIVVATADATFGFTEAKLGIIPAVISPFVVAKIGESHARALFVTGQRFDAERALRIGLVHEVVADEAALDGRIEELLGELRSAGPTAARAAKALVRELRALDPGGGAPAHDPAHRPAADVARGPGGPGRIPREASADAGRAIPSCLARPVDNGLCDQCRFQRVVRNARGSVFSLCERSETDARLPAIPAHARPRLPWLRPPRIRLGRSPATIATCPMS